MLRSCGVLGLDPNPPPPLLPPLIENELGDSMIPKRKRKAGVKAEGKVA